jgi:hypothetical protein
MEATKVITNTPPRSARSVSAAATAPARKSSYRPVRQQRNSSPMARRATTTRSAPSMGVAAASTRMGARDVGTSQGRRAAAFLAARLGGAREGRAALAARRWYCRGGRTGRKRSSLGALSDARGGIMSSCCSMPPAAVAHRHAAALPCRPAAAQQGDTLPGRSTASRGDRGGDAPSRQRRSRRADTRPDRRAVARRASYQRGVRPGRGRPRPRSRRPSRPPRKGRQAPGGRHGRLGLGPASSVARASRADAGRTALLRGQRPYPRATVVGLGRARTASPSGGRRRG